MQRWLKINSEENEKALTEVSAVQRDDLQIIIVDTWTDGLKCHTTVTTYSQQEEVAALKDNITHDGCPRSQRLTKVISVEVPALVAASLLLLVQSLFSIFIIFLPEVFVLQDLVGSIHLQELLMGCGVALKHDTHIRGQSF